MIQGTICWFKAVHRKCPTFEKFVHCKGPRHLHLRSKENISHEAWHFHNFINLNMATVIKRIFSGTYVFLVLDGISMSSFSNKDVHFAKCTIKGEKNLSHLYMKTQTIQGCALWVGFDRYIMYISAKCQFLLYIFSLHKTISILYMADLQRISYC